MGVWTVIYQRTSRLKQCIVSFRNKHRNEHPEPAFLPPKTKRTLVDSVSDCYSCERRHHSSSQSKWLIRLGYNVPLLGTDCDVSQSCTTPVIAPVKIDGIRYHNNVRTILQWSVRWTRNCVSVRSVQIEHAIRTASVRGIMRFTIPVGRPCWCRRRWSCDVLGPLPSA